MSNKDDAVQKNIKKCATPTFFGVKWGNEQRNSSHTQKFLPKKIPLMEFFKGRHFERHGGGVVKHIIIWGCAYLNVAGRSRGWYEYCAFLIQ